EVIASSLPLVIELVEHLHAKLARHRLRLRDSRLKILVRDVLVSHFARAAAVERKRSERAVLGVCNTVSDAGVVVQEGTHDIRVEHDFDRVPLAALNRRLWRGNRRRNASWNWRRTCRRAAAASRWRIRTFNSR